MNNEHSKKSEPRKHRPTYSIDQRIMAVSILVQNGGYTKLGMQLVNEYLGANVSKATLHQWMIKYKDKVQRATDRLQEHQIEIIANTNKISVVEVMENVRDKLLSQIQHYVETHPDIVDKTTFKSAIISAAILQDKIEKAIGMSAAMQAAVRPLAIACDERGLNVYDFIEEMITVIHRMTPEQIEAWKDRGKLGAGN